ncbi:MAG: sulfate adenylyltransferase subunit CysD [Gammaproteobacteria bacterium]|nr:sulfate adenylyltransferase subunit CysD [Gammaproteobacteria bacterium]
MATKQTSIHQTHAGENRMVWDAEQLLAHLQQQGLAKNRRAADRWLEKTQLLPPCLDTNQLVDENHKSLKPQVLDHLLETAKKRRHNVLMIQLFQTADGSHGLLANDARHGRRWLWNPEAFNTASLLEAIKALTLYTGKNTLFLPHQHCTSLARQIARNPKQLTTPCGQASFGLVAYPSRLHITQDTARKPSPLQPADKLSHLDRLEAESIHIMREVMASADKPVMMYSVGKDSAVMLHLARKAFYPSPPPFPLLHVDTRWKFQEMYQFRDYMAKDAGMDLIVHTNPEGIERGISPLEHGSALHTDIMKTEGLKQALDKYGFDVAFGGARRDEEKSRAKERVFSFRTESHRWDPKNQRPELWNLYNGHKKPQQSIRVFPISNWTELDIWQYIYRENIPIVPLYFAEPRPVIERDGMLMMVDDERLKLMPDESVAIKDIRFRTLGCYPLTGAIESQANTLEKIILELLQARTSERQGRAIDSDSAASMEKKKQEGYF